MDSNQLTYALTNNVHTKRMFQGVYPSDKLPKSFNFPASFVVNTDPSTRGGTHWIGLFIDGKGKGDYFDSYGISPFVREHIHFMNSNCASWQYSNIRLQGWGSTVCGNYAAVFLYYRSIGYDMNHFLRLFDMKNSEDNDVDIEKMYDNIFTCCWGLRNGKNPCFQICRRSPSVNI